MSSLARRLVRKRAVRAANSTVTIVRGTPGTLNRTTGLVGGLGSLSTIYTGPARVHKVTEAAPAEAGSPIVQRSVAISIPMTSAMPRRDDMLTVSVDSRDGDSSEADVNLDARTWRVCEVDGGSYLGAVRRLTCTAWFPSRAWTGTT